MAGEQDDREAFLIQQQYCAAMDAPIYARISAMLAAGLTRDSAVGARVLDWPGEPKRDALPLRLIGGLHALVIAGRDDGLAAVFAGDVTDDAVVLSHGRSVHAKARRTRNSCGLTAFDLQASSWPRAIEGRFAQLLRVLRAFA